jgi:hypothetical protein
VVVVGQQQLGHHQVIQQLVELLVIIQMVEVIFTEHTSLHHQELLV